MLFIAKKGAHTVQYCETNHIRKKFTSELDAMEKEEKNPLLCFVCNEKFQRPKILDCLHNYCQKCLKNVHQSHKLSSERLHIRCPLCRTTTVLSSDDVDGAKTNTFLVRMVEEATVSEILKSKTTKVSCGLCDQQATSRCYECAVFLCLACQTIHGRLPASSEHDTYTLDECRAGKPTGGGAASPGRDRAIECRQHPGEKCRFYCGGNCQKLICRDCTVLDHTLDSHGYTALGAAAPRARQSAKDMLARLDRKIPELRSSLEVLGKTGPVLKNRAEKTKAQIQELANTIRDDVTTQEKVLLSEIRRGGQKQAKELKETVKEVSATLNHALHSQEAARVFVEKSNDSEFLWLNPTLMNDLRGLVGSKLQRAPLVLEFVEGDDDIDIGQLESEDIMDTISEEFALLEIEKRAERNKSKSNESRTGKRPPIGKDASDKENPISEHCSYESSHGSRDDLEEDSIGSTRSNKLDKNNPTKPPAFTNDDSPDGRASSKPLPTKTSAPKSTSSDPQVSKTKDSVPASSRVLRSASQANASLEQTIPFQAPHSQARSGFSPGWGTLSKNSAASSQSPSVVSDSRHVSSSTATSGSIHGGLRCPDGKNLTTSPAPNVSTSKQQSAPMTYQSRLIKQQSDPVKKEISTRTNKDSDTSTQPKSDAGHGAAIQQGEQSRRGLTPVTSAVNRSTQPVANATNKVQNGGSLVSSAKTANCNNAGNQSGTDSDGSDL